MSTNYTQLLNLKTASHQWLLSEYSDRDVTLTLNTVNVKVKIAELYENIEIVDS